MREPLTTKQRALYQAITTYVRVTGEPCSASYLARKFSMHHSTVRNHLEELHRKGYLEAPNTPAMPTRPRADAAETNPPIA